MPANTFRYTPWPGGSVPAYPVESLIRDTRRQARRWVRTATAARWECARTWSYTRVYHRRDAFDALAQAAAARRVLAYLLALRRAGIRYVVKTAA